MAQRGLEKMRIALGQRAAPSLTIAAKRFRRKNIKLVVQDVEIKTTATENPIIVTTGTTNVPHDVRNTHPDLERIQVASNRQSQIGG